MIGTLTDAQMDKLLTTQAIGRIGYNDGRKSFITPVTYAYNGKYIYGQSNEGLKLSIMRKNPYVCFEVDSILNMANWESVTAWGHFEELENDSAIEAREYLYNSILDLLTSATIHLHKPGSYHEMNDSDRIKYVMYRIGVTEKTGRYEKQ